MNINLVSGEKRRNVVSPALLQPTYLLPGKKEIKADFFCFIKVYSKDKWTVFVYGPTYLELSVIYKG